MQGKKRKLKKKKLNSWSFYFIVLNFLFGFSALASKHDSLVLICDSIDGDDFYFKSTKDFDHLFVIKIRYSLEDTAPYKKTISPSYYKVPWHYRSPFYFYKKVSIKKDSLIKVSFIDSMDIEINNVYIKIYTLQWEDFMQQKGYKFWVSEKDKKDKYIKYKSYTDWPKKKKERFRNRYVRRHSFNYKLDLRCLE